MEKLNEEDDSKQPPPKPPMPRESTIQHNSNKAISLIKPNKMLLSVEVNNRRTIRLGRRFNKAVTNSLILEMSPMPRGGIRGFQKSGSLQSL